jgi:hypothetical protein
VGEFVHREFPTVPETLYEIMKEAKNGA